MKEFTVGQFIGMLMSLPADARILTELEDLGTIDGQDYSYIKLLVSQNDVFESKLVRN